MKTEIDESLPMNEFYDELIMDADSMRWFLEKYDDIDKIELYQYILRKAKALSVDCELNKEMISYCWLSSFELEQTEAVKRYLRGEVTPEEIKAHEEQKEKEIEEIVQLLEQRRKNKKSMIKQFANMFKQHR